MGADTTSTQLIFFIAATVVATAAAGILSGIVLDLSGKMEIRGKAFGDEIQSRIEIINDPRSVVTSPDTLFYVKNTGRNGLDYLNATVILDGQVVTTTHTLLGGETTFGPGVVMQITYDPTLAAGDHTLRVVMENGVSDDFAFRI
jgi:archaellum component FlaG (FlaF/FlaG flagellin family)